MEALYIFFDGQNILSPTVTDSQVVELLSMLRKRGYSFTYVNVVGIRELLREWTKIHIRKREISEKTQSPVVLIKSIKLTSAIGVFITRAFLFLYLLFKTNFNKTIFVHARGHNACATVLPLKNILTKMHVHFDVRGDIMSEFEFNMGSLVEPGDSAMTKELTPWNISEKTNLLLSDSVSCVSTKLRSHLIKKHNLHSDLTIDVFPCAADADVFVMDDQLRKKVRLQLGLDDKKIIIYSGGVGGWHETDRTLDAFKYMLKECSNVYFLFLSPHVDEARMAFESKELPRECYRVLHVSHEIIPSYFNAGDLAVLLRRAHPLNAVASPTKFAEYVLTGLPVLISDHIGDCSDFVAHNKAGVVVPDLNSDKMVEAAVHEFLNNKFSRNDIRTRALQYFSKQAYLQDYEKLLLNTSNC